MIGEPPVNDPGFHGDATQAVRSRGGDVVAGSFPSVPPDSGCSGPGKRRGGPGGAGSTLSPDRRRGGPGGAGSTLSRDRRAGLEKSRQLAERGPARGVVRGCHGQQRPGHELGFAWQRAERGDSAGTGRPHQPPMAGSPEKRVERGDSAGTGRPHQPPMAVSLGQRFERGDPSGTGRPHQPPTAASRGQRVERGDPSGTGRPHQPPISESGATS